MIEVIEEKKDWNDFISSFDASDLYHTFDYHMIAKEDGKPILLKYSHNNFCIGLPILIRKIPNTSYYDATSVYGYPGPLCKNIPDYFDSAHFKSELLQFFKSKNIVSVFSRLNPFIPLQHQVLENIGEIHQKGRVVSINLKKPIDQQRQEFGRRLKGQLNKVRKHCTVKNAENDEELQEFIDIYYENMDRVNAKPMYYFEEKYFRNLAKSNHFRNETLLAVHNETGEVMGACMFMYKNSVVHYHLSGTKTEYLPLMPTKLLIDEMRIKASKMGLTHFNLGGGLSSANDSLLHFKRSFSKDILDFYVWKLIVNPEVYNNLTKEFHKQQNSDYFPLYRCGNPLIINKR